MAAERHKNIVGKLNDFENLVPTGIRVVAELIFSLVACIHAQRIEVCTINSSRIEHRAAVANIVRSRFGLA